MASTTAGQSCRGAWEDTIHIVPSIVAAPIGCDCICVKDSLCVGPCDADPEAQQKKRAAYWRHEQQLHSPPAGSKRRRRTREEDLSEWPPLICAFGHTPAKEFKLAGN